MATNLYGEKIGEKTPPLNEDPIIQPGLIEASEPDVILHIDMNQTDLTLSILIQKTKEIVDKIESDKILGIYLVSGFKEFHVYDFWNDYFEYLQNIENRIAIIYRGYLHFQNLGFLMTNEDNAILKGSKLIYDSKKLHEIMNLFSKDQRIFNNFSSRFLGHYKNYHYFVLEDLNELQLIGFNFSVI